MIAFIDSSVVLRKLFGEPHPLAEWRQIDAAYGSRLLPIEIGRVIDRCRLAGQITDDDVASLHQESGRILASIEILALSDAILERAEGPMPTQLGSLDAIHLATALELARAHGVRPIVATHDLQLARAARAFGLEVRGA